MKPLHLIVAVVLVLLAMQLVPVDRQNPPVESELSEPGPVVAVLRRACFDCHSHETHWPWYAHVAPASWLVAHDVQEGREHLNFSRWGGYEAEERKELREEVWEEVEEGEMPPWFYLPLHPEASLSDADRDVLRNWSRAAQE